MAPTIPTWRPWHHRAIDWLRSAWSRASTERALHELDRRTLADIGVDPSELDSIEAEARAEVPMTRLRIVWVAHRG